MDWSLQVNLTAGLGALALGAGVLVREPRLARSRTFALLCLALSLWTLGSAASAVFAGSRFPWRLALLSGSCAAAPLALHFVFVLARRRGPLRRPALGAAWTAAAVLWLAAWWMDGPAWGLAALVVLGAILVPALLVLLQASLALPRGPERRAFGLLLAAGTVAVAGGLSDFLPRGRAAEVPSLGPAAMLVFLVIVCGLIVRHRFMDVDVFLTRAVTLAAGAAAGGLLIFGVVALTGGRFLPIALATLMVLVAAGALRRWLSGDGLTGRSRLFAGARDPAARALHEVSRLLPGAVDGEGVWRAIRAGRDALGGDLHVRVFWRSGPDGPYTLRFDTGATGAGAPVAADTPVAVDTPVAADEPVAADAALARVLASERLPLTRSYLVREQHDARGTQRELIRGALDAFEAAGTDVAVALQRDGRLLGWVAIGGGFPERSLTAELATALEAVGHQAVASLDRIEAIERAKQREALAAVGELAGSLAHEVRNPVAAIRGAAQALGPDATPDDTREMLQVIEEESERLGRFAGEFLDYARPASPRRQAVMLEPLVRQSLRSAAASGRTIDATVEARPSLRPALGDPDQLRRVVDNIVCNAWEAGGDGVALRLTLDGEPAPAADRAGSCAGSRAGSGAGSGRVRMRFEDNGPGIPDDRVAALFQPFRTTKPGGTGLGLAIVHRIVEAHGGEVRVEGRPGRGAAFTIVLPAATRPDGYDLGGTADLGRTADLDGTADLGGTAHLTEST